MSTYTPKFKPGQEVRLKARPDIVFIVSGVSDPNYREYELHDEESDEVFRYEEELEAAPRKLVNGDIVHTPQLGQLVFIGWLRRRDQVHAVCWQEYPNNPQLGGEIRRILPDEGLTCDNETIDWGA